MRQKKYAWAITAVAMLMLVSPQGAAADNVTVGCSGTVDTFDYTSLSEALNSLHLVGPHHVAVSGTCTENVYLGYLERVTIQGAPTATIENAATPNPQVVVDIEGSRGIVLRNLTISGGNRGIVIRRASEVRVEGCTIENNGQGVLVKEQSTAAFGGFWPEQAVTVRNNGKHGIDTYDSVVSLEGRIN